MATAAAFAESAGVDLSEIKKAYCARNPIGRECQPDEIARRRCSSRRRCRRMSMVRRSSPMAGTC